jgi:hypothetical protein
MLVIENCNSLSELRQKLIDGEEVRTARNEPCEGAISRAKALEAIRKLPHAGWLVSTESVLNVYPSYRPSHHSQRRCKAFGWFNQLIEMLEENFDIEMVRAESEE